MHQHRTVAVCDNPDVFIRVSLKFPYALFLPFFSQFKPEIVLKKLFLLFVIAFARRKKTLQLQIGVEIVWDNVDSMNGSWDTYLASPEDFARRADGIITSFGKGERAWDRDQRLWSAFDDLDPRLSLFCYVICPCKKKSAGDARCASQGPYTHDNVVP